MWNQKKDIIDYALNYIFRYPKTEKELLIQLRKKGYTEHHIERAITYLKEKNYLNDREFIKSYIDSHLIRKWKPIIYVKSRLAEKWVNMNDVKELIWENIDDINEWIWNQIRKEIEKYKAKDINQLDILQKLTRKWYTINQIKKVLNY